MSLVDIVTPGAVKGFVSAQSALALPDGVFSELVNVRLDDQVIRSRNGSQNVYTGGTAGFPSTGTPVGFFTGSLDGVVWHFVAIVVSGVVQVWAAQDSVGTWTEITSPTPNSSTYGEAYGNSPDYLRLVNISAPIRFQVIHDPGFNGSTPHDLLVIQNGVDNPRVWGPPGPLGFPFTGSPGNFMSISYQPPQPVVSTPYTVLPTTNPYMPITLTQAATWTNSLRMSGTATAHQGTGAGNTLSVANGGGVYPWISQANPSYAGNYVTFVSASTLDLTNASLIAMLFDCPDPNGIFKFSIALGDGTNTIPIWSPNTGIAIADFSPVTGPNSAPINTTTGQAQQVTQMIMPVPNWNNGSPGAVNPAAINTIVITYVGPSYTTAEILSQAAALAVFNAGSSGGAYVESVDVTNGGWGYINPPTVTFAASAGGGTNATAFAVLGDGVTIPKDSVASIVITNPGNKYDQGQQDSSVMLSLPPEYLHFNVVALASSEGVLGTTSWAVAFASSGSRAVGPRLIIPAANHQGDYVGNLQGAAGTTGYEGLQIIETGSAYYDYNITYVLPPGATMQGTNDYILFFSEQPGNLDFYYSDNQKISTWSTGSTWTSYGFSAKTFTPLLTQDLSFTAPDESTVVIPTGLPMAFASGRFFVGKTTTAPVCGSVWYSDFNYPFRFRAFTAYLNGQPDQTSGGSYTKASETIQAIVPVGAVPSQLNLLGLPVSATGMIYILTDKNCYVSSNFTSEGLNQTLDFLKYGTYSAMSVAIGNTCWYFLASDGNVRRIEGWQAQDITCEVVDNLTKNIPTSRLVWVWGAYANLRYYMACSQASGGSSTKNANVLVYSERRQMWESFDATPAAFTCEMIGVDFPASQARILSLANPGTLGVWTYDDPTVSTDVGSAGIALSVLTKEWMNPEFGKGITLGAVGILSDVAAGETMTTTRLLTTGYGDNTNAVGTIPLSVPTNLRNGSITPTRCLLWDSSSSASEDGTMQLNLTATVPAKWRLYRAVVDITVTGVAELAQRAS